MDILHTILNFICLHLPLVITLVSVLIIWPLFKYFIKRYDKTGKVSWTKIVLATLNFRYLIGIFAIIICAFYVNWNLLINADSDGVSRFSLFIVILAINCIIALYCHKYKLYYISNYEKMVDKVNFIILNIYVALIGLTLLAGIFIFNINSSTFLAFGIVASVLGWIFQDIIKGMLAYYHLRTIGLLHIGDWIQVPSQNIDGHIIDISFVSVKIKNFDNSISSFPTDKLVESHLRNNQSLAKSRRMLKSISIDCNSLKLFSVSDYNGLIDKLKANAGYITRGTYIEPDQIKDKFLPTEDILPAANIELFRLFLRNWLTLVDEDVTAKFIRITDQSKDGIILQICAFIKAPNLECFEAKQSNIYDHTMIFMKWFGLSLYQKYD